MHQNLSDEDSSDSDQNNGNSSDSSSSSCERKRKTLQLIGVNRGKEKRSKKDETDDSSYDGCSDDNGESRKREKISQVAFKGEPKPKKTQKLRTSKETIYDDNANNENGNKKKISDSSTNQDEKPKAKNNSNNSKSLLTSSPKKEKKRKIATKMGPMHITANSEPKPVNVDDIVELPKQKFLECKEKMRPVKKVLIALSNKKNLQSCLIEIGAHIGKCLENYKEPNKVREWRSNLWLFVSKFTEFNSKKLLKIYRQGLQANERLEKDGKTKDNIQNKDKLKEGKRQNKNIESKNSLTPTKRKHQECDDKKIHKKLKLNSSSNSSAPLTIPTSVQSTPPSSSSSNVSRPYNQSSNRYDGNYNYHRNRTTPYTRSGGRNENRSDSRNENRNDGQNKNRRLIFSRGSNTRRERYDSSYRSHPGFRERNRDIDSDMRMYEEIRYQQSYYAAYGPTAAANFYASELYSHPNSASYMNLPPGFRERDGEIDSYMQIYEQIKYQQSYAAYGPAAAADFYASELYSHPNSVSYMNLPPYGVSADWHPPVSEYRRDYERSPQNNS